jgi:chorismate lyase / 3-hydroxybenzoate synthase
MSVKEQQRAVRMPAPSLDVFYAPAAAADSWLRDDSVIALVRFGAHTQVSGVDARDMAIALPPLGPRDLVEVWRTAKPVTSGRQGDVRYAANGEILFGHVLIEESAAGGLASATRAGYVEMLRAIDALGYRQLVRVWNYFPGINTEADGLERYRSFCVGRYDAFAAAGLKEHQLAAASAIGTHAPGLLLYFVAAKEPGIPIENPRQVSAYHYPTQYGPRSPLFSRALLKQWASGSQLYISGTASVVGHRTCHENDAVAQVQETGRNIEAVISRANEVHPLALKSPRELSQLKIYLRRAEDISIDREIERLFGDSVPRVYLLADICRTGLLLEIDAVYSEQSPTHPKA